MSHLDDAQEEADVDMTPMIDVVFLLIIFFLCIDFKTLEAKLPAYLPKDKGSQTTESEPVEQLSVKIICDNWGNEVARKKTMRHLDAKANGLAYQLQNHEVHFMINAKRYNDLDTLGKALKKIASDPSRRVPDKDNPGKKKVMPVVIEPAVRQAVRLLDRRPAQQLGKLGEPLDPPLPTPEDTGIFKCVRDPEEEIGNSHLAYGWIGEEGDGQSEGAAGLEQQILQLGPATVLLVHFESLRPILT